MDSWYKWVLYWNIKSPPKRKTYLLHSFFPNSVCGNLIHIHKVSHTKVSHKFPHLRHKKLLNKCNILFAPRCTCHCCTISWLAFGTFSQSLEAHPGVISSMTQHPLCLEKGQYMMYDIWNLNWLSIIALLAFFVNILSDFKFSIGFYHNW